MASWKSWTATPRVAASPVTTRSASGKKIVFRLAKAGGGYTVRDVNMQGIWLAQQMRSKFTGTISKKGMDGLFAYLGS